MTIIKGIKNTIHIGTSVAVTEATKSTAFAADEYVEIQPVVEIGEIGGTTETGQVDHVNTGLRTKYKAVHDLGEMEVTFSQDRTDPGQLALIAAGEDDDPYNFKLILSNGDVAYFRALVMSAKTVFGGTDEHVRLVTTLAMTDVRPHFA